MELTDQDFQKVNDWLTARSQAGDPFAYNGVIVMPSRGLQMIYMGMGDPNAERELTAEERWLRHRVEEAHAKAIELALAS